MAATAPHVDSSVVIAGFVSWHELHDEAMAVLDSEVTVSLHAAWETYAVLTRLPAPHRVAAGLVRDLLVSRFGTELRELPPSTGADVLHSLPGLQVTGGASYDALIAAVAVSDGAELITCDQRARTTYERLGVHVRYLETR